MDYIKRMAFALLASATFIGFNDVNDIIHSPLS